MTNLGDENLKRDPVGYGFTVCEQVRVLRLAESDQPIGLDVEVNHDPYHGHCDVINWSEDPSEKMSQQIEFAKLLNGRAKPEDPSEVTPEQESIRER